MENQIERLKDYINSSIVNGIGLKANKLQKLYCLHRHTLAKDKSIRRCSQTISRFNSCPNFYIQSLSYEDIFKPLVKDERNDSQDASLREPVDNINNLVLPIPLCDKNEDDTIALLYSLGYKFVRPLCESDNAELSIVGKDNVEYVAKLIDLSNAQEALNLNDLLTEASILRKINSPYVVNHIESHLKNGYLILIMEYCENGDLFDYLKNCGDNYIEEEQIRKWIRQIALGLKAIHECNYLHCDIKTSNLFLDRNLNIKIGDLGMARYIVNGKVSPSQVLRTTPMYMSPEMCARQPLTESSDCWSLGCIVYEICSLKHAFPSQINHINDENTLINYHNDAASTYTVGTVFRQIVIKDNTSHVGRKLVRNLNQDYKQLACDIENQGFFLPKDYSFDLNKIVATLLHPNPSLRTTLDNLLATL